jgi:hypothetical protein
MPSPNVDAFVLDVPKPMCILKNNFEYNISKSRFSHVLLRVHDSLQCHGLGPLRLLCQWVMFGLITVILHTPSKLLVWPNVAIWEVQKR